ncbi:hypothetical protein SASPL_147709 [Salvia splendens]|uniref:BHLH domain-containing protein n=1 Tax=Salvia splendens TaxID=180675 RepID=A0A8X8Z6V8_SALSN|nr:hypothetical protein SASPL_147709 [Salvia splendens]
MKNGILSCFSPYSYTNNGTNHEECLFSLLLTFLFFFYLCFYGDFSSDNAHDFDLQNTVDSILVTEHYLSNSQEPTSRRRSQKLTDKITTLQKLVSPYGKTDTASVLLEASVSIQALQDQIKEMFHIISGDQTTKQIGERRSDLQSRGLCLVPSVFLEELDRQFVPTPSVNLFAENH